jgi:hypothetical protein
MVIIPLAFVDTLFPQPFTSHCRKPLLRPSSYPPPQILEATTDGNSPPGLSAPDAPPPSPIRVDKTKGQHKVKNVFVEDRGFLDVSNNFDMMLHNINGGPVLRKLKHPPPDPDGPANPLFLFEYDTAQHGKRLYKHLNLSHLDQALGDRIYTLVIRYWSVFDKRGIFVLVQNYKCVIDTCNAAPIAVKKIYYGPKEIPIMHQAIAALQKVGHIQQIHNGRWLFKAILDPKPHQEHVRHINGFVWRFCVNYVPLNLVTRIIA